MSAAIPGPEVGGRTQSSCSGRLWGTCELSDRKELAVGKSEAKRTWPRTAPEQRPQGG